MGPIEIKEICKDSTGLVKLDYSYSTDKYYEIINERHANSWNIKLEIKLLGRRIEKSFESSLFKPYVDNPKAFVATKNGEDVAYMQLGHEDWTNRVRIWELLVLPNYRGCDIGTKLINKAKEFAVSVGARGLVLETQSCNVLAIDFYLKCGFQLIGFDLTHYSNEDLQKKEVRLEFGLAINELCSQ